MSGVAMTDTMGESVRNAKARFGRINPDDLRSFIESQSDVVAPIVIGDVSYPTDGAGSTNGIGFFEAEIDRGSGPSREALVVRFSPGPTLLSQKSFSDEFATLKAVAGVGVPVPKVYWLDATGEYLGQPGYIMERISGDMPTASLYSVGPFSTVDIATRNDMMLQAAAFHGRLRKAALGPDHVPHLTARGPAADTAVARELGWWIEEGRRADPASPEKLEYIEKLYSWMLAHEPKDLYTPNLVHGDAQFANLMYRNGVIVAALDWELSFLGHNESDLALLTFITESQKVFDMDASDTPTEADFIARFEEVSGHPVCHYDYFRLFCMFKVQAIALMVLKNMPHPEAIWEQFKRFTQAAWDTAKATYGK